MYSEEVKEVIDTTVGYTRHQAKAPAFEKWKDWPASQISHHGKKCCDVAREWVRAIDLSALAGESRLTGPRWLVQRFTWGASAFPIFWCEAVRKSKLDCGALAALAHEVFFGRGIKTYRVQMVQRFSEIASKQWFDSWNLGHESLPWTNGDLIYHEGCAVLVKENKVKVWDASAGWWIDAEAKEGYGSLLALRISKSETPENTVLMWGKMKIPVGSWVCPADLI